LNAEAMQDAREWGDQQVSQLLTDRPQLKSLIVKDGPAWKWLSVSFGNSDHAFRMRWDKASTTDYNPQTSESAAYPDRERLSYIRVDGTYKSGPRKGEARSGEEVLRDVVFELNNAAHGADGLLLTRLAVLRQISRANYIRDCAYIEFEAYNKTEEFYKQIWAPYCRGSDIFTRPNLWLSCNGLTFDQWIALYPSNYWYPWKYYGNRFDQITTYK
jgi:hypothetical protein